MSKVLKPFVLACYDTSLGAGRLSADWVPALNAQIRDFPEAKGPIYVYNMGHGGWTSNDLLAGVGDVINLKPTHLLTELGAINDCPDFGSGPAVSLTTKNANNQQMLQALLNGVPSIDVTVMTMSSVSAIQTSRTQLGTYYAAEIATAQSFGLRVLDNYNGVPGGPSGGWPKPLALNLTHKANPIFPASYVPPGLYAGPGGSIDAAHSCVDAMIGQDGLTFTTHDSIAVPVRGSIPLSSGKVYAQFYVQSGGAGGPSFGLVNGSASMATGALIGGDANGWGLWNDGSIRNNFNNIGAGPSYGNGNVMMLTADLDAHKIWFGKNGVWTGDPVAETGGITIPAGTYYIAASTGSQQGIFSLDFSNGYDGLHPIWTGAVDTYLFPNVVNLVRPLMAAFWA